MGIAEQIFGERKFKCFTNRDERYELEIPTHWRATAITQEYGYSFSDEEKAEGILSVKPVVMPGTTLEEYHDALLEGMKKELRYKFFAGTDTRLASCPAKEIILHAPAKVNGKKKKAIMSIAIIDDSEHFRYVVMSYSVLESRYEKYIEIYNHAKNSFRLLNID